MRIIHTVTEPNIRCMQQNVFLEVTILWLNEGISKYEKQVIFKFYHVLYMSSSHA